MITVIVTLHNREKSIISALQSIVAQTAQLWECVIVDNASTDASEFQIRSYLIDRRMRYVHLEAMVSTQEARAIGLAATKGEWVMFLDGADYLESNALQALYLAVKKYGTLAASGNYAVERDGESFPVSSLHEGKFTGKQVVEGKFDVVTCNTMFARSVADQPEVWPTIDYAYTEHLIAVSGNVENPLVTKVLPLWKRVVKRLFKI